MTVFGSAFGRVPTRETLSSRLRFGPAGASDTWRLTRGAGRWAVTAVLILACAAGVSRAIGDLLAHTTWSAVGLSVRHIAEFTGPWLAQAGLILALIFRWRRVALVLCAATLLILAFEPLVHWASFKDMPGPADRYYVLYLATVCAVFPVFHRQAARHRRAVTTASAARD